MKMRGIKKYLACLLLIAGINVPILSGDTGTWVRGYVGVGYDTSNGLLNKGQYAVEDNGDIILQKGDWETSNPIYYERHNDSGVISYVTRLNDSGDTIITEAELLVYEKVNIACHACKYVNRYVMPDGTIERVETTKEEYDGFVYVKDAEQPTYTETDTILGKMTDLVVPTAYGAIAYDTSANNGSELAVSSISWSHTTVSGSQLAMVIDSTCSDTSATDRNITATTYNSISATQEAESENSPLRVETWSLINPATGANTVAVTFGGTCSITGGTSRTFTGVDQTDMINATSTATGTNTGTATDDIVTVTDNSWVLDNIHVAVQTVPPVDLAVGADQTEDYEVLIRDSGADSEHAGSREVDTTPSTVTMSWTLSGTSDDYAQALVALKAHVDAVVSKVNPKVLFLQGQTIINGQVISR